MPFRDPEDKRLYEKAYRHYRSETHRSVKLTMTKQTYELFLEYAKQSGQSVAKTILQLAEQKHHDTPLLHPETKNKLDAIIRLLRSSGNNINQIAHACNIRVMCDDDLPTPDEGKDFLESIHQGMNQLEVMIKNHLYDC